MAKVTPLFAMTLALGLSACIGPLPQGDDVEADAGPGGGTGGSGDDTGGSGDDTGDAPQAAIPFACPGGGGTIFAGENTLTVGDLERRFTADFPAITQQPMGVLFLFHGFGDTPENFRTVLSYDPDSDGTNPLIVITPESTGLNPPAGLAWDIARGTPEDANVDIAFFEAMLGCLAEQYDVDAERVYAMGFSAGAVMTNLLYSRHPEVFAAIVTESGAWFNDPAQAELVRVFDIDWNWPALDPADAAGAILMTHGGDGDQAGALGISVLDLEASAQAALPFLAAANRVVVDCAHDGGHTLHPDVVVPVMGQFYAAHTAGAPSPWPSAPPAGLPPSCTIRAPQP